MSARACRITALRRARLLLQGKVAFEAARALLHAGANVAVVLLIDAFGVGRVRAGLPTQGRVCCGSGGGTGTMAKFNSFYN